MNQYPGKLFRCFLFLLSLVALLWPALYNGFPLVYPDTGAYISSGLRLSVHPDRPVGYGLFILFSSMGISLWFVVVAQALMLNWLIRRLCRKIPGPVGLPPRSTVGEASASPPETPSVPRARAAFRFSGSGKNQQKENAGGNRSRVSSGRFPPATSGA